MFVYISTLGCKVNQYESQVMLAQLTRAGYTVTCDSKLADIFIVNSCTVTANSDKKTRALLHRFRRENPNGVIILTGCMTQALSSEENLPPEADIILGNTSRADIIPLLRRYLYERKRIVQIIPHANGEPFEPMKIERFEGRTRAFMKIEDGCNCFCSYCIIPYARGRVRSKPIEDIKNEAAILAKNGYSEIVLVGINLSSYGRDLGIDICDAVSAVAQAPQIKRIRLGSLEPDLMTKNLIERLAKEPKLCPQFHISLQSGCDQTLKRMNRKYLSKDYYELVTALRQSFKNCAITTDIMVGFAGETDEEFKESLEFAKKVGFARTHVFAYSRRKGTAAYDMGGQLTNAVKESRSRQMSECGEQSRNEFLLSQIGTSASVLLEQPVEDGFMEGYTPNYTRIVVPCGEEMHGKIADVVITGVCGDHCTGILKAPLSSMD